MKRFVQMAFRITPLVLVAAMNAPFTVAAQFPTSAPAPGPIKPAVFPPFEEATLPNGMRLLVVHSAKQPVVAITLAFAAGSAYDPPGKSGLAIFTAGLLTKGAGKRTADQIASAIEGVGGSIAARAGQDFLTLAADVLAPDAPLAFELLADAAIRPSFIDREVELVRTQALSALQLELSQPAGIAARAFAKGLYGEHPYGRRSDPASVKAITRADLLEFHRSRLRPAGALLVVAGSLSLAEARRLATASFGNWTGAPLPAPALAAPPNRTATEILLVHKPGAVQSNILVGDLTWAPTDARSYAATVANKVLGDGANARLFLILREKKSWTYGAYSSLVRHRGVGHFEANTEVRTEVTDSALVELLVQLKRIGSEPLSPADLDEAKNSITGAFPLGIESANQVAAQVSSAKLLGLPPSYVASYRQRISAVTAVEVQAAAKAAVRPERALIVVVGDGSKIYEQLRKIAPVKIVSVNGAPLTADDFKVKAASLNLPPDRLVAHSDSFAILVQGNPLGWETTRLERVEGGWSYKENVQIAAFVQQTTEVRFSEKLEMQSVHQSGKQGGQDTKIDVLYAGGRAKGSAVTAAAAGPKSVAVDADVPPGAIDDNLLTAILPALSWAADAKFHVAIFQSGKGAATTLSIDVSGAESVKVPAGTFDAWKADITGGDAPVTVWIEKGAPHRLLKLALAGQPVEFQLVK